MWPRRAHILAPLTELCGAKHKFKWTDLHENAFNQAKKLVAEDVLLRFPDHTLPFEIFTDASAFQIGATIKQKNFPIAYFSKKITPTQRRYSTIEQEMLAIKGHNNVEADALSRLPMDEKATEVMLNHPPLESHSPLLNKNPLDLMFIKSYQEKDVELQKAVQEDKTFFKLDIRDIELVHHQTSESNTPKIVIPNEIQYAAIRWMHSLLGHAGITRLSVTLRKHFWFPNMTKAVTHFVQRCKYCQRYNKQIIK